MQNTFFPSEKKSCTSLQEAWDHDLCYYTNKLFSDKHFKRDLAIQHFCNSLSLRTAGMYIKPANKVDIKRFGNHVQNCIWFFLDWQAWPCRIFRHYGFKDKVKGLEGLRVLNDSEADYCNRLARLSRIVFYNYNQCAAYHLRNGFDIDFLIELSASGLILDSDPLDVDKVQLYVKLPIDSKTNIVPDKCKKQYVLPI